MEAKTEKRQKKREGRMRKEEGTMPSLHNTASPAR
jgi:hypothetical protein